jgi:two-component system, cell cycle sensor histidine kinase and response regulator CckA
MTDGKTIVFTEDGSLPHLSEIDMLKEEGYRVIIASSGEEAIDILRGMAKVDVILMDFDLGTGTGGTEAARAILEDYDTPLIFLCRHTEKENIGKAENITPYGWVLRDSGVRVLDGHIKMAFTLHETRRQARRRADQFRAITHTSIDGFCMTDASGRFLDVNDAYCAMTGYARDELLEMVFSDLEVREDDDAAKERGQNFPESGSNRFEARQRCKDGRIIAVEIVTTYLEEQRQFLAFIRDITEQRKTEEMLRESEKRYRLISENAADVIWVMDPFSGRFTYVSPSVERLRGYTPNEVMSQPVSEALTPESDRAVTERLSERLPAFMSRGTGNQSSVNEVDQPHKDGSIVHTEVTTTLMFTENGRPEIVGVTRDITERKRAQEALKRSEEQYRLAIESSNDGVSIVQNGRHVLVNQRYLEMFGYDDLDELTHKPADTIVHPDDRDRILDYIRRGRSGKATPSRYEFKGIRKDGRTMFIDASTSIVSHNGGPAGLGYFRDVTERKMMEDTIRESETKLRAILDGSRDAIGVSKEGAHAFANPAYVSLFGYESSEELLSVPVIDLIAPESRAFVTEIVKRRSRGEPVPSFYEVTAQRKDGTTFLMESTVSVYTLNGERSTLGIMRDITERRRAEEEIRMLKLSIDVHYDGAYWMDRNGRFIYVNEAACTTLGYGREELMGKSLYDVNHSVTPDAMEAVWEGLRKRGSFVGESVHRRKDGSEFPVEIVTTYVQFGGQEFACGFARDITKRKNLEEQFRQAQKMEAIGTLAGGVAHDFNNILTVITGLGTIIQMSLDPDDRLRPHIDQILLSSERAADLTQSLLAFSRKRRIALEPHRVNTVVTSAAKFLRRLLPEDIELKMDLGDGATVALLDVTQIDQVLMNLATNARDAMPGGGTLTIKTDVVNLDGIFKRTYGFGRAGTFVRLSVSDTGSGMDEKTMARIFDPFFTTKEVGKGTGLGLASVYGTVKQHHGYITVSSQLHRSTTFDVYLPLVNAADRPAPHTTPSDSGGPETILVVEDDLDVRNMVRLILSQQGYTTLEAADGDAALAVFDEHRDAIGLVILDVVMPRRNGKEILDDIHRINPAVKAILMSGYTADIVIDKGVRSETVDFLQKPLSVTGLLAKVREVLDR